MHVLIANHNFLHILLKLSYFTFWPFFKINTGIDVKDGWDGAETFRSAPASEPKRFGWKTVFTKNIFSLQN